MADLVNTAAVKNMTQPFIPATQIARAVAALTGEALEEVARRTTRNARAFYNVGAS